MVETNKVLIAKKVVHTGALHGWASNGLGMLDLGNNIGMQIVVDGSKYATIQLFQFGIGEKILNQTYMRTKKVIVKKEKKKKKTEPSIKFKVDESKQELF